MTSCVELAWRTLMATYAKYTTFQVANEADKYRIAIGGYNGTAGDSMVDDGGQTQR